MDYKIVSTYDYRDPMRTDTILHLAETRDEVFLYTLYCATRAEEMALWDWEPAQQEAFLRFQFNAQRRYYATSFPEAENWLVTACNRPIGAMLVATEAENLHLIDIALLPEARGRGIGTNLLQTLQKEARQKQYGITLSVRQDNRSAMRLYERLGFQVASESDTDVQMRWSSGEKDQ